MPLCTRKGKRPVCSASSNLNSLPASLESHTYFTPLSGLFITEALHPFKVLKDAGFEVDLISETGTYQPDWLSQQREWLPDKDRRVWENHSSEFRSKLDNLMQPSDVDASEVNLSVASFARCMFETAN